MKTRLIIAVVALLILGLGAMTGWIQLRKSRDTARLKDQDPAVRVAAIRDAPGEVGVDLLIEALGDEDADVRLVTALELRRRGPEAAKATEALIEALADRHPGVRREAAEALCWIGPKSGPALYDALKDPNPRVRAGAALALGDIGNHMGGKRARPRGEAKIIEPILKELLQDEDEEVRKNAAHTLKVLDWDRGAER
jgi:HEAT repeat protein